MVMSEGGAVILLGALHTFTAVNLSFLSVFLTLTTRDGAGKAERLQKTVEEERARAEASERRAQAMEREKKRAEGEVEEAQRHARRVTSPLSCYAVSDTAIARQGT
eukprot:1006013-Rhodomonas_salina.2